MSQQVVIIGANKGIGLEFVRQYLDQGDRVYAVCRHASDALRELDCNIIENIDVADNDQASALASQLPCPKIDVLIHNAGILVSDSFPNIDLTNMQHHFNVNTLGLLRVVLALQHLLVKGSKVGIVSSRVGSIEDNSSSNNYAYRVSKTAVNMVGKCLSLDLQEHGIAVALLHPGYVRTDMTRHNGLIDVEESVTGLINIMNNLTLEQTGQFFHTSGEMLKW